MPYKVTNIADKQGFMDRVGTEIQHLIAKIRSYQGGDEIINFLYRILWLIMEELDKDA